MKYTIINVLILSMVLLDVMPEPARKSGSRCTRNDDDIYELPAPTPAPADDTDTDIEVESSPVSHYIPQMSTVFSGKNNFLWVNA